MLQHCFSGYMSCSCRTDRSRSTFLTQCYRLWKTLGFLFWPSILRRPQLFLLACETYDEQFSPEICWPASGVRGNAANAATKHFCCWLSFFRTPTTKTNNRNNSKKNKQKSAEANGNQKPPEPNRSQQKQKVRSRKANKSQKLKAKKPKKQTPKVKSQKAENPET